MCKTNLRSKIIVDEKIKFPAIFSTGFIIIRNKRNVLDTRYLFYLAESWILYAQLIRKAVGSNYPAITQEGFESSYIPVGPYDEQKAILELLESSRTRIEFLKSDLQQQKEIKKQLIQKLLN
ncbi:MAG: restriction endonuclease subunit S [Candidatus Heimdallarchaeota archaeon]|nr:restriction endonuclease subunit S [Candidatus Heimdallarchaeota archaeon]